MTVYVLYIVTDTTGINTDIKGVFSTKEKAEVERTKIKKHLSELNLRNFVSVRIDECEMGF